MKLKIENKTYDVEYTLRSFFVYEQITGMPFAADKLLNEYTLLYAILIANNRGFEMTFEGFIEACDKDNTIFISFRNWFVETLKQKALLLPESAEPDDTDKKKD